MIGQFVISKAGHDAGTLYVVVGETEEFVKLSDGIYKKIDCPKKKRRKHIQPVNRFVTEELLHAITNGSATDEKLKFEIRQYKRNQTKDR